MIPENISKEHVLQAIQDIDLNGVKDPLAKSRKYDLVFNNKSYPPKYTIALANQFANGEYLNHDGFNTYQAQDYLKNLGPEFVIKERVNDPIADLIVKYKKHVKEKGLHDELYKWKLLERFQGRPDVTKADFYEELKSIDFFNLIYPMGITVTHDLAKNRTEAFRECFKVLFNEEKPLAERIRYFNEETLKVYRELVPEEKFSHHQDERTIATYLTYHDPDKYTFYKDSFYQKGCKLLDIKAKPKGEKYVHYLELVEDFIREYIVGDQELLELVEPLIDSPDCFRDKNHKILAQDILYQTLDKQIGMERAYWRIGTTDGATSYWEEMKTNNKISIGWPALGDLADVDITSKKSIISLFNEKGSYKEDKRLLSRKAGEVFNFYSNVKPGDVVLAQEGASILGIGIVTDDYSFNDNYDFPHQKQVDWKIFHPKITNKEGLLTTVSKLSGMALIKQLNDLLMTNDNPSRTTTNRNTMESVPLNQIFYGPPGTGKTYDTINEAISIANPDFDLNQSRTMIKQEFDRLQKEGQIVFTTFHQSMSYEDFIEGIKPLKPNQEDRHIKYDVVPGIFKKICQDAKTPNLVGFDLAYEKLKDELTTTELLPLKTPTGKEFSISLNSNDNLTLHTGQNKEKQGTLTKENIQKQINGEEKFKGWEGYFKGVVDYLKSKYQYSENDNAAGKNYIVIIDEINRGNISQIFGELITLIEEDKRLGGKEALEVTLPYSRERFGVPSNIYLIGTMNTADRSVEALDTALRRRFNFVEMPPRPELLSPGRMYWDFLWKHQQEKRDNETFLRSESALFDLLGAGDNIKVNRKEIWNSFENGHPKNESRISLFPDSEFNGINLKDVLVAINRRVVKLLDKDHQIGHSYFMSVGSFDDLKIAFHSKIIPLLQEYFFGDFGKAGLVLGEGFFEPREEADSELFADFNGYEALEFADRPVYRIKDILHMENEDFKKVIDTLLRKKDV